MFARMNIWCGWLALLCCCGALSAQAQQLPLRHYGQLDGLENLAVTTLQQDQAGYLWVGTENGLYRFEGGRLQRYGAYAQLPAQAIVALHADADGALWVGTSKGLCRWHAGVCTTVLSEQGQPLPLNFSGQTFAQLGPGRLLLVSGFELWQVQQNARHVWQARRFFAAELLQGIKPLSDVSAVIVGHEHDLWLSCGHGMCHFHGGVLEVHGAAQGLPDLRDYWSALLLDDRGELWVRSREGMMMSLAPGASRWQERRPPQLLLGGIKDPVLVRDIDGRLITSGEFGLLRGGPGNWQSIGAGQGFKADDVVTSLLVDQEHDLWIGLAGRGLVHWRGYRQWENWTTQQGLPSDTVWSIFRSSNDRLYLGTDRGMTRLSEQAGRFSTTSGKQVFERMQWSSWAQDHSGQIWAGTFSGALLRLDSRTGRPQKVAQLPMISKLLVDRGGQLWITTDHGLYWLERPDLEGAPRPVSPLRQPYVGACQTTQGALWFTRKEGLMRFFNGQWRAWSNSELGLKSPLHWQELSCDENNLWLVDDSSTALYRIDADATARQLTMQTIGLETTPLHGRMVMSLLVDRRHWLWVSSDYGVAVWNGTSWQMLNQQSGLISNDASQHALYEDRDGSIWIGTSGGVSHLKYPEELFKTSPLQLSVAELQFDGTPLPVAGLLSLPWRRGVLTAKLSTASARNHEALRYRFRLLGLEDDWVSSALPVARYAGLAPGNYILQMMVENQLSHASSKIVEAQLSLTPPWWRQSWFYLLLVLLALAGLLALSRWRLATLLQRQHAMEQLVRERTQELEASREEHRRRASVDSLTGIWNRAAIIELIAAQIAEAQRSQQPFMLVLLDIDHFKRINDQYGHLAGDAVLREFVRRAQELLRSGDALGRYGGEEFLLLLPGLAASDALARLSQIHHHLSAKPCLLDEGVKLTVTASMGVASELGGATPEALIRAADLALYRAKALGRNRIEFAD